MRDSRELRGLYGRMVIGFGRISCIKERVFLGVNEDYNIEIKINEDVELCKAMFRILRRYHDKPRIAIKNVCLGQKICIQSRQWENCGWHNTDMCPPMHTCIENIIIFGDDTMSCDIRKVDHLWINDDLGKMGFSVGSEISFGGQILNYYIGKEYDYSFDLQYKPEYLYNEEFLFYRHLLAIK